MRDTETQMILVYIFFMLPKLTDFWKCTSILSEYSESTFLFCFLAIILDYRIGWEVFAFAFFLPYLIPSKCIFLIRALSLQWTGQWTGSFSLIFPIRKWLILTTSWKSMKHLRLLTAALVPILIIQPYCFNSSFQLGSCSDSFHPPWTQEYSYPFHLENKTSKKPFPYCPFWYKSGLIFRNADLQNLSVESKQVW